MFTIAITFAGITVIYEEIVGSSNATKDNSVTIDKLNNGTVNMLKPRADTLVIDNFLPNWHLKLMFNETADKSKFFLVDVKLSFTLNNTKFPNPTNTSHQVIESKGLDKWQASLGNSYQCSARDSMPLDLAGSMGVKSVVLLFENIQVGLLIFKE